MAYSQQKWDISEERRSELIAALVPHLKTLRVTANISQESLAQLIEISRQTYCQLENGSCNMSWQTYLSLIFIFDVLEDSTKLLRMVGAYPDVLISELNDKKIR